MKIICHKCKTTQDKGRYCVNADCYHPFRQGGWSTKISNELNDTIGINESTINNNQKNETVEKCSNCDKEKEPDSIYCSNCGWENINHLILSKYLTVSSRTIRTLLTSSISTKLIDCCITHVR